MEATLELLRTGAVVGHAGHGRGRIYVVRV